MRESINDRYKSAKDFILKYALELLIGSFVLLILIQEHVPFFYDIAKLVTPGSHGNWMSFWGSYLGVVASGVITYSIFKRQNDIDKKLREDEHSEERERYRNRYIFEGLSKDYRFMLLGREKIAKLDSIFDDILVILVTFQLSAKTESDRENMVNELSHLSENLDNRVQLFTDIGVEAKTFSAKYLSAYDIDLELIDRLIEPMMDYDFSSTYDYDPMISRLDAIKKETNIPNGKLLKNIFQIIQRLRGEYLEYYTDFNDAYRKNELDRAESDVKFMQEHLLYKISFLLFYTDMVTERLLTELKI